MQTVSHGGVGQGGTLTASFPNAYIETVYRLDISNDASNGTGPDGVWTWLAGNPVGGFPFEFDIAELYGNGGADGAGGPGVALWANWDFNCTYNPGCTSRLPGGYSTTAYHKYGALFTSNGTNSTYFCTFIDDVFQSCAPFAGGYAERSWLVAWVGGRAPPNTNLYIQYIRVWSCSDWSTGSCNGSTLAGSGGGTLSYWHP
jgi:hypothetical protein